MYRLIELKSTLEMRDDSEMKWSSVEYVAVYAHHITFG